MSLLATFLEGVYKTSTSGLLPHQTNTTSLSIHLTPSRADEILKSLDDPELETYLTTSIEIQQIHILEQDAIFKMVDEFCNSYTEALKQPSPDNTQENLAVSNDLLEQSEGSGGSVTPTLRGLSEKEELGEGSDQPNSKKRRGNLPKASTNTLKKWLYEHLYHPYPTEEEKKVLEAKTGMTLNQISNWFINARRRILQPMLESVRQGTAALPHGAANAMPPNLAMLQNSPPLLHNGQDPNVMLHHAPVHPNYRVRG
eukprot:TRINITY_DN363_c0_g1_i3.p1 TRINITY_DN363_c0_g1~~TRINITY_DN363_c0_g1_i3.p1  ORF type:complete len:256 (+),score=52.68 TRINITY_DN363_c0_g1_i3:277-1044(+)